MILITHEAVKRWKGFIITPTNSLRLKAILLYFERGQRIMDLLPQHPDLCFVQLIEVRDSLYQTF